jgi:hypothetical protein
LEAFEQVDPPDVFRCDATESVDSDILPFACCHMNLRNVADSAKTVHVFALPGGAHFDLTQDSPVPKNFEQLMLSLLLRLAD